MRLRSPNVSRASSLTCLARNNTVPVSRPPTFTCHHFLRPSTTAFPQLCLHRRHQSSSAKYPERIAVLGGGIAGLSSAYYAAKEFPKSKIVLFEAGKETGGWIRSRRVNVEGYNPDPDKGTVGDLVEGSVVFELGPRTLRNATVTAGLIQELGLVDSVRITRRTEPGAKNRFIYYPDQLNRLPADRPSFSDFLSLWKTGILGGAARMLIEPFVPQRPSSMTDETVGSFLSRRVDKRIADNLVSAVFHGIYAGDIWQLSARTLLSLPWQLEKRYSSALGGFFRMQSEDERSEQVTLIHPHDLAATKAMNEEIEIDHEFVAALKDAAMFTFKDGLQELVRAMQGAVEDMGNVEIKTEAPVQSYKATEGKQGVEVISGPQGEPTTDSFDLAISSLPAKDLTPYVTVMTVNMFFKNPRLLPVSGFGYLIPQSIPFEQNPERALGVIFDSSAIQGQDTVWGTKITVMMGGHWWDGWSAYPTEEEGLAMARSVVERHIGLKDEPSAHVVNLSKDCIPQYTLGYEERLKAFAENTSSEFGGRLRVVGNQFNGVGVNDIIAGSWNLVRGLRGEGWKGSSCALDKVGDDREWVVAGSSELAYKGKGFGGASMGRRGDGGV